MPSTINGVGTWYYGKLARYTRRGTCEHCGAFTQLHSYDTTLYFVVLFVPVLPLRKLRVLDECRACKRHNVAKLKEWNKLKHDAFREINAAMNGDPGNVQHAEALVLACAQFQDLTAFNENLQRAERVLKGSSEGLQILAAAHSSFGRREAGEAALRRALELEDSPEVRQSLAIHLMLQLRPKEAREFVQHLIDDPNPEGVTVLAFLVESAQAAGEHAFALEVLDEVTRAYPDVEGLDELRRASTARAEGSKIASPVFLPPPTQDEGSPLLAWGARLIGPAIAALLLLAFVGAALAEGQARKVFFVNGLDRPYSIEVQGQTLLLPPNKPIPLEVPEGELEVSVVPGTVELETMRCTIATAFWTRPFTDETFVINPDRCALLTHQRVVYRKVASRAPPPDLRTGRLLHEFKDLDYVFQTIPPTLRIQEDSASRVGLNLAPLLGAIERAYAVQHFKKDEACVEWIATWLEADPNNNELVHLLAGLAEPKRALEILQPRLARRPLLVDWHRAYQGVRETDPDYDLVAEYRALLAELPETSEAHYLLARVLSDPDESKALYERAVSGENPTPYGYLGLAYQAHANGEDRAALALIGEALRVSPADPQFAHLEHGILLSLGRYPELTKRARSRFQSAPNSLPEALELVKLMALAGDKKGALLVAQRFVSRMEATPTEKKQVDALVDRSVSYASNDLEAYAKACLVSPDPTGAFWAAVARRKFADARASFSSLPARDRLTPALTLVLLAARGSETDRAQATEVLKATPLRLSPEERMLMDALTKNGPADHPLLRRLSTQLQRKTLFMCALGLRYPAERAAYFALARKLNSVPEVPQHLVGELVKGS